MNVFVGIVVGFFVLMMLVTLHEFGHFMMARRNGVKVLEFGIGFPPRAVALVRDKKSGKWRRLKREEWGEPQEGLVFSLNYLPIGGFCQMYGESAADKRKGTFGAASFWAKTKVLFGGVMMNWLVAFVIFTILAWTGMPKFLENQFTIAMDTRTDYMPVRIVEVVEGAPAERAGLSRGDYIEEVDGERFYEVKGITDYNEAHAGESVVYTMSRKGAVCEEVLAGDYGDKIKECLDKAGEARFLAEVELNSKEAEYLLGAAMEATQALSYSTWSAPIVGAGLTLQVTGETFRGVAEIVWKTFVGIGSQFSMTNEVRESGREMITEVGESVSGPVGIVGVLFPSFAEAGLTNVAFLAAIISVSLACMNVLPIPALDGGRWLLIVIYKLRKKELTKEVEEKIVSRAMVALLILIAIITILDIKRIF
ncbi:MAG: M50 family metallopeptidase [Candidatus Saccharibacteria bacterium]|nr:M50 family metallopeptidase [Candidatus Saccharibacteria bacterium]